VRRAGLAATDQLERVTGQQDLHWHSSNSAAYRLEVVGLSEGNQWREDCLCAVPGCLQFFVRRILLLCVNKLTFQEITSTPRLIANG
jgi:hypothetical protein